ncbi:hypothetical protein ACVXG7_19650 [Enterobacter hormaechei]
MNVKRYEWVACDEHSCHCDVVESTEGDMVDYEDYAALEARCASLAAESESVASSSSTGGVGYIRLPDEDTADSAKATYERCLSVGKSAPCQKCNDTGMTDSGGTQPWGESIEIECDCLASQLRKGVQS